MAKNKAFEGKETAAEEAAEHRDIKRMGLKRAMRKHHKKMARKGRR